MTRPEWNDIFSGMDDEDEYPYDDLDAIIASSDSPLNVRYTKLLAENEELSAEVARLKAVIEENAKVYMRAIEYALTAGDNHAITFPH